MYIRMYMHMYIRTYICMYSVCMHVCIYCLPGCIYNKHLAGVSNSFSTLSIGFHKTKQYNTGPICCKIILKCDKQNCQDPTCKLGDRKLWSESVARHDGINVSQPANDTVGR